MRTLDRVVLLLLAGGVLTLILGLRGISSQDSGQRLASADVLTLVEDVLRTDVYADPRVKQEAELFDAMQAMQAQMQMMSQELQTLQPGDPRGPQLYADLQAKQLEAQNFQQRSFESFQSLGSGQAKEVYATVRAATARVAEREGFSHVIANRAGVEMEGTATLTAVTQEILARPLAVGADRHDLTALIRAELGLPEPGSEPEASADDDAPGGAEDAVESGSVEEMNDQPAP